MLKRFGHEASTEHFTTYSLPPLPTQTSVLRIPALRIPDGPCKLFSSKALNPIYFL